MTGATSLRLAAGPLAGPVLCRVVSMVLARADCPVDRLDDALLACEEIASHGLGYVADGHLAVTLRTDEDQLELRVGELAERGAEGMLAAAAVPGVGNVLERVTDEQRVESAQDGGTQELVLAIGFRAPGRY
jgi:serine/threonine-protein kinase RsbW